jgi:GNAT superfamily N-acetyltransferase
LSEANLKNRKEFEMQEEVHQAGQEHDRADYSREPAGSRRDGAVYVRAVSSGDEEGLRGMCSRLSKKTIYQRFHMPYPRVPGWALASFTRADDQAASLVAVVGEEIIGHAIYVRSDSGRDAEFALVVEDRWQSQGVGKLLLSELYERARHRGVETFTGEVLGENRRVLGLLDAVFVEVNYLMKDGVYYVRAPLKRPEEMSPARTGRSAA